MMQSTSTWTRRGRSMASLSSTTSYLLRDVTRRFHGIFGDRVPSSSLSLLLLRLLLLIVLLLLLTLLVFALIINAADTSLLESLRFKLQYPGNWNRTDSIDALVDTSLAVEGLPKKGQLFCYVLTSERYHDTRVPAVNETWLSRCDHGQFFTGTFIDDFTPHSTVFAGIRDDYEYLFFKTIYALHYTYTHISKDFDWYFKADDDTFVVVENLREYLSKLDPNKPYYAGFRMRPDLSNGYNSGGAGYVLSREAMRLFDQYLYHNWTLCPDHVYEDLGLGRCFANIGVYPLDTRNKLGQQRFNAYHYEDVLDGRVTNDWILDPQIVGINAVGKDLISLHHIGPNEMRIFDRLVYTVLPSERFSSLGSRRPARPDAFKARYIDTPARRMVVLNDSVYHKH